jgi:hypothetical protein
VTEPWTSVVTGEMVLGFPYEEKATAENAAAVLAGVAEAAKKMDLASKVLDLVAGGSACGIAGEPPLAGFQELLRPAVVEALGNAFATAQLRDRVLAAQAVEDDADLLFGGVTLARRSADVLDDLFR